MLQTYDVDGANSEWWSGLEFEGNGRDLIEIYSASN